MTPTSETIKAQGEYKDMTQEQLRSELERVNNQLETEQRLDIRFQLQDVKPLIEQALADYDLIEESVVTKGVMSSMVTDLEAKLTNETLLDKRELAWRDLNIVKISCVKKLADRKRPIKERRDFNEAAYEMNLDTELIDKIDSSDSDYYKLEGDLRKSDLWVFFQNHFDVLDEQLSTSLSIKDALDPLSDEDIESEVQINWTTYKEVYATKVQAWNEYKLENGSDIETRENSEEPTDDERRDFMDSEFDKIKRQRQRARLEAESNNLPLKSKDEIRAVLIEARSFRMQSIEGYIQPRFDSVYDKYKTLNQPMEYLDGLKVWLSDTSNYITNSDYLLRIVKFLEDAEMQISVIEENLNGDTDTSQSVESIQFAKDGVDRIEELLPQFLEDPEILGMFSSITKKKSKWETLLRKNPSISSINTEIFLGILSDEEKRKKFLDHWRDVLDGDYDDPEDLREAVRLITNLDRKLTAKANANETVTKAKDVIKSINDPENSNQTSSEMIQMVKDQFGEESIEIVSNGSFEEKYRKYTATGYMVFYERGDEWKLIVSSKAINTQLDTVEIANKFKKQITHELTHVILDNDPAELQKWLGKYRKSPNWNDVKSAFIAHSPNKMPPNFRGDKTTFTFSDWKEEDIVHELVAMGSEIKDHKINNSEKPFDNLCKAIVASGVEPTIRGYSGIDEVDDGDDNDTEFATDPNAAPIRAQNEAGSASDGFVDSGIALADGAIDSKNVVSEVRMIKEQIEGIRENEFFGEVKGLSELVDVIEEAIDKYGGDEDIRVDAKKDLLDASEHLTLLASKNPKGNDNFFRSIWNNSIFLSIDDIVETGKQAVEFFERRHKRNTSDHAARFGSAIFANIPFLDTLALSSQANKEKAELEYVQEWKGMLENKDAWELLDMIDTLGSSIDPNQDQLKAVLRILADKGRINWNQPALWNVLNKLQTKEKFRIGDKFLLRNPSALRQKLMSALGEIYDYDEFLTLDNTNESSFSSKKDTYKKNYDRMQSQLDSRMEELLRRHRDGLEADPAEMEAIIEYSIEFGKSHAENVMFYLITSMATGLLAPDRGLHMDKMLNNFPALEWFTEFDPPLTRDDFKAICNTYFPGEFKAGKKTNKGDFQHFYWSVIQNSSRVAQRVEKSVSERGFDHDWSRSIATIGDADSAERFLCGRSGQKETKPTAVQNAWVGSLQWFEENSKAGGESFEKFLERRVGFAAMMDGIMEDVAFNKKTTYTRKESLAGGKVGRESGNGHHATSTAQAHREKVQQGLDVLDPVFFSLLRDKAKASSDGTGNALSQEIVNHLNSHYGHSDVIKNLNVTKLDDVFSNLQSICSVIVQSNRHKFKEMRRVFTSSINQESV